MNSLLVHLKSDRRANKAQCVAIKAIIAITGTLSLRNLHCHFRGGGAISIGTPRVIVL